MKKIILDITKASSFLKEGAVKAYEQQVNEAHRSLEEGTCPGNDFLGWLPIIGNTRIPQRNTDRSQHSPREMRSSSCCRHRRKLPRSTRRNRSPEQLFRLARKRQEESDYRLCRQQHQRRLSP